jgi:hypothetical protein
MFPGLEVAGHDEIDKSRWVILKQISHSDVVWIIISAFGKCRQSIRTSGSQYCGTQFYTPPTASPPFSFNLNNKITKIPLSV